MATVQDVIDEASALLGDRDQTRWDFEFLLPLLQKAHRELQVDLNLSGLPVLKKTSAIIVVPALTLTLGVLLPIDLIEPVSLAERQTGTTDLFDDMIQTTWEPEDVQLSLIHIWRCRRRG